MRYHGRLCYLYLALLLVVLLAGCSTGTPNPAPTSAGDGQVDETASVGIDPTRDDGSMEPSGPTDTPGLPTPTLRPGETPAPTATATELVGPTAPPTTPTSPPSVVGGHITELIPVYPQTLNPLYVESEPQARVASLIFNGLMEISPTQKAPTLALAESVDVSADGQTYTFRLRPGVKWHDGTPLTSSDVVWTYSLLSNAQMDAPLAPYAARIRKVTGQDADTVVFTLSEPYSPFLARLATVGLIPRAPFQGLAGEKLKTSLLNWSRPIGTGPFKVATARAGQSIGLAANAGYFRGAPLLDAYNFRVARDPAAIQQALNSGEADLAWLPPSVVSELSEQDFLTRTEMDTPTTTWLVFNLDQLITAKLRDALVRRALLHALNLERISAEMGGVLRPTSSFQPPTSPAYPAMDEPVYAYDPKVAGDLLKQAGWTLPAGSKVRRKGVQALEVTLVVNQVAPGFPATLGTSYAAAVRRIVENWRAVGVKVTVVEEGLENYLPRLFSRHEFDVALLSLSADADPDLSYIWSTTAYNDGFNIGRYTNPQVDSLQTQGLRENDLTKRLAIYEQVQGALIAELPAAPLGVTRVTLVQNNRVQGISTDYWSALQHTGVETWSVEDGV